MKTNQKIHNSAKMTENSNSPVIGSLEDIMLGEVDTNQPALNPVPPSTEHRLPQDKKPTGHNQQTPLHNTQFSDNYECDNHNFEDMKKKDESSRPLLYRNPHLQYLHLGSPESPAKTMPQIHPQTAVARYCSQPMVLHPLGVRDELHRSLAEQKVRDKYAVRSPDSLSLSPASRNKMCPQKRKRDDIFEPGPIRKEEEEEEKEEEEFEENEPTNDNILRIIPSEEGIKQTKLRKLISSTSLRVPQRNMIPNLFVLKKTNDKRGKTTKKERAEKEAAFFLKHTNGDNYSFEHGVNSTCSSCGSNGDRCFIYDRRQGDTVCTNCSVVQSQCQITEDPRQTHYQEINEEVEGSRATCTSSRRAYISEKLRQFSNTEPRIPDEDLSVIRNVYHSLRRDYHTDGPYHHSILKREDNSTRLNRIRSWFTDKEEDFTKATVKGLLKFIDKDLGRKNSGVPFVKKYLERWTQIKEYFCGTTYYERFIASKPPPGLCDFLLRAAVLVSEIYDDPIQKRCALEYNGPINNLDPTCSSSSSSSSSEEAGCCGWLRVLVGRKQEAAAAVVINEDIEEEKREKKKQLKSDAKRMVSRNIPSINVLFLILLYMYGEDALEDHGWYYVSKNMHNLTFPDEKQKITQAQLKKYNSPLRNFQIHRKFLIYANNNLHSVLSTIYQSAGLDLKDGIRLPETLEELIEIAARNTAAYQYPIPSSLYPSFSD